MRSGPFLSLILAACLLVGSSGARAATSIEPAYARLPFKGPHAAEGIVIYSHGRSLVGEDSDSPPPKYLELLASTGWDAARFNRPTAEDTLPASSADLAKRVQALHQQGYRRIVLAGQSFGGFLSLMAAAQTNYVDAVIATSPAAFGNYYDSFDTWQRNASELYRHLERVRAPTRVMLAFFFRDEYDPGGRADRARSILGAHHVPFLVIDQPRSLVGHLAGASPMFADRFGDCLRRFAEGAPDSRACDRGSPIPVADPQIHTGDS